MDWPIVSGIFRDPQKWDLFMVSFPYYSHTTPIRVPKDMGIVWETYHKGVPLLGVPENPTDNWGCGAYRPHGTQSHWGLEVWFRWLFVLIGWLLGSFRRSGFQGCNCNHLKAFACKSWQIDIMTNKISKISNVYFLQNPPKKTCHPEFGSHPCLLTSFLPPMTSAAQNSCKTSLTGRVCISHAASSEVSCTWLNKGIALVVLVSTWGHFFDVC